VGSIPTTRSSESAHVAQSVEHVLGKDEVTGSIPVVGSNPESGWSDDGLSGAQRRLYDGVAALRDPREKLAAGHEDRAQP
jgi:hypothetical protein